MRRLELSDEQGGWESIGHLILATVCLCYLWRYTREINSQHLAHLLLGILHQRTLVIVGPASSVHQYFGHSIVVLNTKVKSL